MSRVWKSAPDYFLREWRKRHAGIFIDANEASLARAAANNRGDNNARRKVGAD
jgi:hypothetical protein